jgi:16S rRNA (adenine1518-N6/adenine1519-N6)-dimethyltransferase
VGRPLGQHFLTNIRWLDRIVDALDPQAGDVVIEVGAGTGTLTRRLAPRVSQVVALERDRRLLPRLKGGGGSLGPLPENVEIVPGDALAADWPALARGRPFKVVGNIPYHLTSPLIEKALQPPLPVVVVYLMQREVAERLTAVGGSKVFGALTAGVRAVAATSRVCTVPPGAFSPPPKVNSAVVRIVPLAQPLVPLAEQRAFRAFLVALFAQRRKQLRRSLQNLLSLPAPAVEQLLAGCGIAGEQRPETLSAQALARLFHQVGALTRFVDARKL